MSRLVPVGYERDRFSYVTLPEGCGDHPERNGPYRGKRRVRYIAPGVSGDDLPRRRKRRRPTQHQNAEAEAERRRGEFTFGSRGIKWE